MDLEGIRKNIEEHKKEKLDTPSQKKEDEINKKTVEKIVGRLKKHYKEEGLELEGEASSKLSELRGMIADQQRAKIEMHTVDELREFKNPFVRGLGRIFLVFRGILNPLSNLFMKLQFTKKISFYMYSANMNYSLTQYIAISIATAFLMFFIGTGLIAGILYFMKQQLLLAPIGGIVFFFFTLIIMFFIPKSKAQKRGNEISVELPFALRHMATNLKSGMGLYKTIQTIACSDYGALSDEFARTITEVEEGTDTRDALAHLAARTQSEPLRNALLHINRALKTGGNLSNAMNEIAQDVSFELRMSIQEFSEKTNFFGVIFIVGAIVAPVTIALLSGIANAPLGIKMVSVPPELTLVFFCIIMPLMLGFLVLYLKMIQPKA
jgi:pilus assembly protein TadC